MYAALPSLTCKVVSFCPLACEFESYIAHANIFNKVGVNLGLLENLLQQLVNKVVKICVLEAAFLALGQRCSDGESYHDIVGVLGGAVYRLSSACGSEALLRIGLNVHCCHSSLAWSEMRQDRAESLGCHLVLVRGGAM